jgi:hypothetical protein
MFRRSMKMVGVVDGLQAGDEEVGGAWWLSGGYIRCPREGGGRSGGRSAVGVPSPCLSQFHYCPFPQLVSVLWPELLRLAASSSTQYAHRNQQLRARQASCPEVVEGCSGIPNLANLLR